MRKQIKGLVGISLVSIVAFGAAFSLQSAMTTPVEEYEGIVVEGHVESMNHEVDGVEVKEIKKVVDKKGNLSGYVVTVSEKGYGGEMSVDVAIDTEEMKLIGVHVGENNETGGIGSQVTEPAFLEQFKGMALPVYMDKMGGNAQATAPKKLKDGTYKAESARDEQGYANQAVMEVKDGKIASLVWDCVNEDGVTKRTQAENGEYIMTEDGLKWGEQSDALAKAVVEAQSLNAVPMDEQGKTDAVAGVSINVMGFTSMVEDCLAQAGEEVVSEETTPAEGTEVEAISGATISSRAVARAIVKAYEYVIGIK